MELFELYSKEKADFFLSYFLLRSVVQLMLIKFVVSLEMDEEQQNG